MSTTVVHCRRPPPRAAARAACRVGLGGSGAAAGARLPPARAGARQTHTSAAAKRHKYRPAGSISIGVREAGTARAWARARRRLTKGPAPAAAKPRKPFTVVVPFLDTAEGRAFAAKSLPSAASLGPDEILVGVDVPAAPDLAGFLAGAASAPSGAGPALRAVEVERSPEWRLHPARVVHRCLEECRTDTALLYNMDTILRRDALRGLGMVGTGGASLVSFSLRMRTDGPGARLRYLTYRLRALVHGAVNSGMFWLHLPDYFGHVDAAGYARIANGFDTYIFESLAAGPDTRVVADRTIGADALDRETGDLEWRQFGYGLWLYARRRRTGGRLSRLVGPLGILKHAALNSHPYSLKGWNWARANPESEPVRIAAGLEYAEWGTYHEPGQVRDLMDWPEHGTGFDAGPAGRRR